MSRERYWIRRNTYTVRAVQDDAIADGCHQADTRSDRLRRTRRDGMTDRHTLSRPTVVATSASPCEMLGWRMSSAAEKDMIGVCDAGIQWRIIRESASSWVKRDFEAYSVMRCESRTSTL